MTQRESQLQQLLVTMRTRLIVMSAMVGIALEDACKALLEGDIGRASAVIDGDEAINDLENEIDAKALSLLARTQPVACDLRMVVSSLRMVVDFERIADEAASIAERTILMDGMGLGTVEGDFKELMELSSQIYKDAVNSFRDGDPEQALNVCKREDDIALLDVRIMHKLTHQLEKDNIDPQRSMLLILINRSLNRICRRAVNIAEHTYFIYAGISLKHKKRRV